MTSHQQRFWTAKEREFLASNVGQLSYKEMARALGRSRISVKGALRRYHLTEGRPRPTSPWQDKLRSMVQRGFLDPEIMKRTGWSRSTVWRRRTTLGIKGLTKNVKWAGKLRMLHAKGYTDSQIAYATGIRRNNAIYRRRSLGLPPNPRTIDAPSVPWFAQEVRRKRA